MWGVWEDAWGASLNWAARPELPPRGALDAPGVPLDPSWVEGGLLAFAFAVEAVEVVAAVALEQEIVEQLVCGTLQNCKF